MPADVLGIRNRNGSKGPGWRLTVGTLIDLDPGGDALVGTPRPPGIKEDVTALQPGNRQRLLLLELELLVGTDAGTRTKAASAHQPACTKAGTGPGMEAALAARPTHSGAGMGSGTEAALVDQPTRTALGRGSGTEAA